MGVSTTQMMVGPGRLRKAPVGTDDALIIAGAVPDFTGWSDVGATDDGINMTIAKSYANHTVDQSPDWVASTITERHVQIEINLVEQTLDNLKLSLNGGVITTGANWDTYTPDTDLISTQEQYTAFTVEGVTLAGKKRIIAVRRALNVDNVGFSYKKDAKTMFACSWAGHFVSDAIAPFVVYTQK